MVRSEASVEVEFVEIRQNGTSLWIAQGRPFTTGQKELRDYTGSEAARAAFDQIVAENRARGFVLLHTGSTMPGSLDFELLEQAIFAGAREAYLQMCRQHPAECMTGFALVTDHDGMTICPAAMAQTSFEGSSEDFAMYRTNPSEWPFVTDAGLLLAYRMILVAAHEHMNIPFEAEIPSYYERFFETCIRALERLDRTGIFGSGQAREEFLLLFGDSDGGPTQATIRRLNPPAPYRADTR